MRLVVALLGALTLCACPERPDPPDDPDGGDGGLPAWPDGDFVLGSSLPTDPTVFQPMPAELQLVPGAQGGFHVPVMYRVTNHTQRNVTFEHRVRRAKDNVLVSRGSRYFDVAPGDGGVWTSEYEVVIFMCPTPVGVTVIDEPLNFEVRILDERAKLLSIGAAQAVVRCPAGDSFCQSICRG